MHILEFKGKWFFFQREMVQQGEMERKKKKHTKFDIQPEHFVSAKFVKKYKTKQVSLNISYIIN